MYTPFFCAWTRIGFESRIWNGVKIDFRFYHQVSVASLLDTSSTLSIEQLFELTLNLSAFYL
jgi:hypothetical protein